MSINVSPVSAKMGHDEAVTFFSSSGVAMVLTNPALEDNPIIYVNRSFERLTGYTAEMVTGRNCRFLQGEKTSPRDVAMLRAAIEARKEAGIVLTNYRANGEAFRNALLISPVTDETGDEVIYFLGLQCEVFDEDQGQILENFEGLIAEIQHRVKNHLSMILGLIRMKSRSLEETESLNDVSRRIESLQLLYEEMSAATEKTNENNIQLGAYLGRVANAIAHLDGRAGVRMNVHVEPLIVETEAAVRIGLIVSEILTNAMQHAFTDQTTGLVELRVTRTDDGGMRAIISDDGVGLPDDLDWPSTDGLGGRIVLGLCEGLGATLNVARGAVGTIVTLDVPVAH